MDGSARRRGAIGDLVCASLRGAVAVIIAIVVLAALAQTRAEAAPLLKWRVENPFRLFADPADTEVHRATYESLSAEERRTPILSAERALQRRHEVDGWASTMFRKTCWDWKDNRYGCAEITDYMNPDSHRVRAEIEGLEEATSLSCTWLTAPLGGGDFRGKAVTQPCSDPFFLNVPYPDGAEVKVEIGGREILRSQMKVSDLLIVGLGDSFASGEGNPDVPVRFSRDRTADYGKSDTSSDLSGYPARIGNWRQIGDRAFIEQNARWEDQACHRSLYSHQFRAALQLAVEDPHRAITYVGLACSGAEVTFGLFLRYKGNEWVPNPPVLSQISAAAQAQCGNHRSDAVDLPEAYHINGRISELKGGLVMRKCPMEYARKIDLVYVSIGGNDVGFSRLVANAILADQSYLKWLGGWIGEVHGQAEAQSQIVRLGVRYKSLNRALHNLLYIPWNESDRIILTGYPGMALTGDGSETCKDGRAGMEILPDFRLSEQKLREGAWIGDKLHRTMRESAYTYGWSFVETHRRAFIDRGICSGILGDGTSIADELRLPRKTDGKWFPYNPADYRAYTTRRRWFRTPNDAFMTGNFHVAASLLTKVLKLDDFSWFQLLLASTYSGAFHPTAEGQAAIADAVAEKSRVVLTKHGQGSERERQVEEDVPPPPAEEPWVPEPDVSGLNKPTPAALGQTNPNPPAPEYDDMPTPSSTARAAPALEPPAPPAQPQGARVSSEPPVVTPAPDQQLPATGTVPMQDVSPEQTLDTPGPTDPALELPTQPEPGVSGPAIGAPDPGVRTNKQPEVTSEPLPEPVQ
ncbi:MAG: hypothetical protein AB7S74_13875 [Hyphomicrobium sp.]